jgi:hypothetical protein
MTYYTWDQISMCIATVGQLTAWRNADVKLATGECVAADQFKSCFLTLPTYQTTRRGTSGYIKTRDTSMRKIGRYTGTHLFQTAQFIYWIMQACSTTENTPAGYNTHAITLNSSVTPLNFGIHFQHKLTSNNLLWDALGLLPRELRISCSEINQVTTQQIMMDFAHANTASDDFTKVDRAGGTTGTVTKNWNHAVAGGLGGDSSALSYNAGHEWDVVGFDISLRRDNGFYARDSTGYPTIGEVYGFDWSITLNILPRGDMIWDIMNTEKASYAGDLDLDFKLQADATNDYVRFVFDKLYLMPTDKQASYDKYTDSYQLTFEPMSNASSLTVTAVDSLNNDHYENP